MSTAFVSQDLWPQLTQAARACRQSCAVAVAYFGKGAGALLPLPKGSRLVVDVSERAVASGQTCPADLLKMVQRGVRVFSVPNLHAKVFVIGRAAYIGSANASNHSAGTLIEALLRTTEAVAVRAAREFVQDHCLHELTPTLLRRLAKLYRPPLLPGGKGRKPKADTAKRPTLPRLLLAQLEVEDWNEREQADHDQGLVVAKKRREHPRSYELDSFRLTGKCRYKQGDVVVQVLDEGAGTSYVSPPGNVRYVRTRRTGNRQVSFVYLERPARNRRSVGSVAKKIDHGSLKQLRQDGIVRDAAFAQSLLNLWTR
ncbi:hypothetical protein BH11VER1_BH11VER1_30550 [soil metagenome]